MLRFRIDGATWELAFSDEALTVLGKHIQRGRGSKEAVGQLYSRDLTATILVVDAVTLLKPTYAAFARVQFDRRKMEAERHEQFQKGLHCLGIWHSHPEAVPHPSGEDRRLARDHALAAKPGREGLVFVILGNRPFPQALAVWVDDGEKLWPASLMTEPIETAPAGAIDEPVAPSTAAELSTSLGPAAATCSDPQAGSRTRHCN